MKWFWKINKFIRWSLLALVAILVAARIALPHVVLHFANKKLATMDNFRGHIGDVDISLITGSYALDDVEIRKIGGSKEHPFLDIERIKLAVSWRDLFRGKIVAKVDLYEPEINYVFGPKTQAPKVKQKDSEQITGNLIPFRVARLRVFDGRLFLKNMNVQPIVDLAVDKLYVNATNLVNTDRSEKDLFANVNAKAEVLNHGKLNISVKLDPLAKPPEFDFNGKLTGVPLKELNNAFQAYGGFDVEKGRFDVYSEVATKDNRIRGYVKPFLTDVDVLNFKKDVKEGPFKALWEGIAGSAMELLENQSKDQSGAQINIEGNLSDPEVSVWRTILSVFEHAFGKALTGKLEGTVNLSDLKKE